MSNLAFRNVDVSPRDPVVSWPVEAIQTALERGGLSDWRRLAAEIRKQPWGTVARQVEEVLSYSRPYGVAEVMERVIARARAEAERSEQGQVAQGVNRLREKAGLTSLAGTWRGHIRIADDFDELPDDLAESLGMRP